jgi:predicted nucleic acid-binding Zn ribbon protein
MPRSNDFTLSEALSGYLQESGLADGARWHYLQTHWAEVVGPAIAKETAEVVFHKGVCTLRIKSATWRHQLLWQKTDLLQRLNEALGGPTITELRIV